MTWSAVFANPFWLLALIAGCAAVALVVAGCAALIVAIWRP